MLGGHFAAETYEVYLPRGAVIRTRCDLGGFNRDNVLQDVKLFIEHIWEFTVVGRKLIQVCNS